MCRIYFKTPVIFSDSLRRNPANMFKKQKIIQKLPTKTRVYFR